MLRRQAEHAAVRGLLQRHRVVGLIGARQVGKTTLARDLARGWKGPTTYLDLEIPTDRARLREPMLALRPLRGLVVIDEVRYLPELFPVLRVLVDRPRWSTRFLVLGSASPELLRQGSESLAGRIYYHELGGFSLAEVGTRRRARLWLRGGLPRSFLARSNQESIEWRQGFIRTFLERDVRSFGSTISPATLRRFWIMLAHYHAQTWNGSELARAFGVADHTVRRYLDLLTSALVVRQLLPWHENISKRQVKAPKIYLADSGLLHSLLGIHSRAALESHPKVGASWEGIAVAELIRHLDARPEECYFWATHSGSELDLLVVRGRIRRGFEVKRTASPRATRSMHIAIQDLKLDGLDVVYAGDDTFPLADSIRAVPLARLLEDVRPLRGAARARGR